MYLLIGATFELSRCGAAAHGGDTSARQQWGATITPWWCASIVAAVATARAALATWAAAVWLIGGGSRGWGGCLAGVQRAKCLLCCT